MIKKTFCHGCTLTCGLLAEVEGGRVVSLRGDPTYPLTGAPLFPQGHICVKGVNYPHILNHKDRLLHPLRRAGGRGEGRWEKISWHQALEEIAEKLTDIKRRYGAEAVALASGGLRSHEWAKRRFMNLLGSPNMFSSGNICYANIAAFEPLIYGWMAHSSLKSSRCIVLWGGSPFQTREIAYKALAEAKGRGAKLIVVDPRHTVEAEQADVWLQLKPGSDSALLMGWLNVIIGEELYDREFVERWTVGFKKLAERVEDYTPERVEALTWVPRHKIAEAARLYAKTKPAGFPWYLAIDCLGPNTAPAAQARCILRAITGNLDVKGGDPLPGPFPGVTDAELEENEKLSRDQKRKLLGAERFRVFSFEVYDEMTEHMKRHGVKSNMMSSNLAIAHPPTAWRAMITGEPYPVKALLNITTNPFTTFPNGQLIKEALMSLELHVEMEIFMTPAAELADYVLPAAVLHLEVPFLNTFYGFRDYAYARDRAVEPPGECMGDWEFLARLGRRLGQPWPWNTIEEVYDDQLKPVGFTWRELLEKGGAYNPPTEFKKYERHGFATPSGKVEVCSSILERYGYDPLPHHAELVTGEELKSYPFILSGRRFKHFNGSEQRHVEEIRRLHPDPLAELHPEAGARLGVGEGEWVWIETPKGRVKFKAKLTDEIDPRVVYAEFGWWFPERAGPEHGIWDSNINAILDDDPSICDPALGSYPLRGLPCRVYKS